MAEKKSPEEIVQMRDKLVEGVLKVAMMFYAPQDELEILNMKMRQYVRAVKDDIESMSEDEVEYIKLAIVLYEKLKDHIEMRSESGQMKLTAANLEGAISMYECLVEKSFEFMLLEVKHKDDPQYLRQLAKDVEHAIKSLEQKIDRQIEIKLRSSKLAKKEDLKENNKTLGLLSNMGCIVREIKKDPKAFKRELLEQGNLMRGQ